MYEKLILAGLAATAVQGSSIACGNESEADVEQRRQTAALVEEAHTQVGMPALSNFQEKRLVRMLYELRDQADLPTWTYIVDMQGNLHLLCQSVGYGIPYAVQFSNPERRWSDYRDAPLIPQPEPNGLFMPDALSATWVLCAQNGQTRPAYVEPQIVVSQSRLH